MARQSKKSVYERIEDKKLSIKETEELLVQLNNELQELFAEKDDLEMRQLLSMMKSKGLTIDEAAKLFQDNLADEQEKETKKRKKKETITEDSVE
jgi:DNA-binding transcriptional MerR regulator